MFFTSLSVSINCFGDTLKDCMPSLLIIAIACKNDVVQESQVTILH